MISIISIIIFAVYIKIKAATSLVSRLPNDEHYQFFADVDRTIVATGAGAVKIIKEYDAFRKCFNNEDTAYKNIGKSEFTAKLKKADSARDFSFAGLRNVIIGATSDLDPEVAESATRLKIPFGSYGNLARKGGDSESAGITNLLQELNGKYANDVIKVNLTARIAKLDAENKAYIALTDELKKEGASKTPLKVSECRKATDKAFAAIVERVNAAIIMEGEEDYAEFVREINFIIDRYRNHVAQRDGRASAKKKAASESDSEGGEK
jgi:hypothetical protein